MMTMTRSPIAGLAISLTALLTASGLAQGQQVGTASAVNPAATANMRTIAIGASISHKERIQTQAGGSVQLLFIDKTSMTIGPNSDLTIDEYVFDPNANTGKLAATLGKGALRFVGGQISHNGEAEVKTASAVIGIRGGINFMTVKNGETQSYTGYGSSTVSSGGATVTLGPGEYTQTQGSGAPPTPPGLPPTGFVAAQVQTYQSSGGQSGGAPAGTASPARVANAEQRATGSPTGTVAAVAPVATNGTVQVAATTANRSSVATQNQQNAITTTVTQAAQTSTQSTATTVTAQEITQQRQFGAMPYALSMSNCCGSNVPYLNPGFATGNNFYLSPVLGYRTASVDVANRAPFFQYGLGITGVGAAQTSWFMVATGALVDDGNGGFVFSSGFGATRRGAANLAVGRASGAISSIAGSVGLDNSSLPTTAQITDAYYIPESKTYVSQPAFTFLGDGSISTNYDFSQVANRVATPAGLGDNRPTVNLSGWAGGLMRTTNVTAGAFQGASFMVGGPATINLDATSNRMQANFYVANFNPSSGQTFSSASYQIGTVDPSLRSRGVYVDYDNFAGREAVTVSNTTTGATVPVSIVNGKPLTGQVAIMANVPNAVARQIAAGTGANITFCQCDYTRWGFWSNDSYRTDANGNQIADRGNLMTWVAGRLPNISEVPTTGVATYDGHVIASVKNGANEYVTAGNLTNTVNFGTRTGSSTVTGLDSANYAGNIAVSQNDPRNFSAGLSSSTGRSMVLTGQFFRGVAGPVSEMGGGALIQGTNYMGSGIFAAKAR
jgi:hypothetical protein